jgi:hypothetical protein
MSSSSQLSAGRLLASIWSVSTQVSLPLGGGTLDRGLHHAHDLLPDALRSQLSFEEDEHGNPRCVEIDGLVDAATEGGLIEIVLNGEQGNGVVLLTTQEAEATLASAGLSRSAAYSIGRRIFDGCTRSPRGVEPNAPSTPTLFA